MCTHTCALIYVHSYACNHMCFSYACNHICFSYACNHICFSYACNHICVHRYVWSHRTDLARSVHDMAKQMYNNKKYSNAAWDPLTDWVCAGSKKERMRKSRVLTKFTRTDEDFHKVVSRSLFNLACGSNVPWGRGAVQPQIFDAVPAHEKVMVFFLCFSFLKHIYG